MASTQRSTQPDQPLDGGIAPTAGKDRFTGVEEALARLAHQGASDTPDARLRGPASDRSADARTAHSLAETTLGPSDLRAPIREQSLRKRGTLARAAIGVCLGVAAIWAWQSYGGAASDMMASWGSPLGWISARLSPQTPATQTPDPTSGQAVAPAAVETSASPPVQAAVQAASQAGSFAQPATTAANEAAAGAADRQQIETMARDLAALRQTVEQLIADQEQLTREVAKLQAEKAQADKPAAEKPDRRMPRQVPAPGRRSDVFDPGQNPNAPGAPRTLGSFVPLPARKPAAITAPQAAPQVSTVSPVPPPPQSAPQIASEPRPSDPAPRRPPMPVPQ